MHLKIWCLSLPHNLTRDQRDEGVGLTTSWLTNLGFSLLTTVLSYILTFIREVLRNGKLECTNQSNHHQHAVVPPQQSITGAWITSAWCNTTTGLFNPAGV